MISYYGMPRLFVSGSQAEEILRLPLLIDALDTEIMPKALLVSRHLMHAPRNYFILFPPKQSTSTYLKQ